MIKCILLIVQIIGAAKLANSTDSKDLDSIVPKNDNPYSSKCSKECCDTSQRLKLSARMDKYDETKLSSQSPIMITTCKTVYNSKIKKYPLKTNYNVAYFRYINTGTLLKWIFQKSAVFEKSLLINIAGNKPETRTFKLAQFQIHWGSNNEIGSEHFLNDESFAAELQLIHWNISYSKVDAAMSGKNGIVIIAIFVRASRHCPRDDDFLDTNLLPHVINAVTPNQKSEYVLLDLNKILPENPNKYYYYNGSLTTSPYTENAKWIVMKNSICASFKFLDALRSLKTDNDKNHGGFVMDNFRNIMPLNGRIVYRSFNSLNN